MPGLEDRRTRGDAGGARGGATLAGLPLSAAARYQLSPEVQSQLAQRLYQSLRAVFLARWAELGHLGDQPPLAAREQLMGAARASAASIVANHNRELVNALADASAQHMARAGSPDGLEGSLHTALAQWSAHRVSTKPIQVARYETLRAYSLADLFAGHSESQYVVDGPPPSAATCPACRGLYQQVLSQREAWSMPVPHPGTCEHYVRLRAPDEHFPPPTPPTGG